MLQKQNIMSAPADMMPPPPTQSSEYGQGDGAPGMVSAGAMPPMMSPAPGSAAPPANGGFQIKQVFIKLN